MPPAVVKNTAEGSVVMSAAFRRPWKLILSVMTNFFGRFEGRSIGVEIRL
jgi:hypothetical protein